MGNNIKNKRAGLHVQAGFTLMEIMIVIGLIAVVMSMSLFMDINGYRGDAFRSEEDTLGTALQTARSDALNNIDEKRHGVAIHPGGYDGYVIFEGDNYASRDVSKDESTKSSYNVSFTPTTPSEVVFDQLTGDANYDGDITLMDPQRNMTANISINHEGKISW
jgi:prepilin-type N-terminal cleavage/methylation domain-containing protein